MQSPADRPNLRLVPPVTHETDELTLKQKMVRGGLGVLAIGAVVILPSSGGYGLSGMIGAPETARTGDTAGEVTSLPPVTTLLKAGESPWQTAARDLANARKGDPAPTDAQIQRASDLLENKNHWIEPELAEPGRINGLTPDETASILDNRPIERTK